MTSVEIKAKMYERIEHLTDYLITKLYAIIEKEFDTSPPNPLHSKGRKLGTMPGLMKYMSSDFDEPLDDFEEYMASQNTKE